MTSSRQFTELGWAILQRLAERKLTRKQFCLEYGLSESRLSELITGNTRRNTSVIRGKVLSLLDIQEDTLHGSVQNFNPAARRKVGP
ncbi:hypothetical protein [Cohnella rhizosphaerae]|uniref:XRE family transcriptional regulator n=1 Tax=Cohnella rhizosphaerae TaxID=1457232 RepID=A0A9X4L032_9BACL|nr:hypothetical protein [Cohnella rhizosphaerae]MDG0813661.1 hypothetical protein [Cohnella rhizosphaerae]